MIYSETNIRWEIVFSSNNSLLAFTNQTEFPVGSHPWKFLDEKCVDGESTWRMLLLHKTVEKPGYFCCGDGSCISSEFVCDNNQHCDDR